MSADEILDIADHATRMAMRRGRLQWRLEDWQDARAEAAVGILKAIQSRSDAGPGYCYKAAMSNIYNWMKRWIRGKQDTYRLLDYVDVLFVEDPTEPGPGRDLSTLVPHLKCSRRQGWPRRDEAVANDLTFLRLSRAGYSIDGIALEMHRSRRGAQAIREHLLPRLARIAHYPFLQ